MFRILDSFTDPIDQLALDEALLLAGRDAIRLWEFSQPTVVAGRSTRIDDEIDRIYCDAHQIPILRRCTGGASVVGGPGCLMYSIILSISSRPALRRIDAAHSHVMTHVLAALQDQLPESQLQGVCDLTWGNQKCSGNSLRMTRDSLLYHGTILYDFKLKLIARSLKTTPRQPEYRAGRDHAEFVTNVPIDPVKFGADLCDQFQAIKEMKADSLRDPILKMRRDRYDDPAWHFRH